DRRGSIPVAQQNNTVRRHESHGYTDAYGGARPVRHERPTDRHRDQRMGAVGSSNPAHAAPTTQEQGSDVGGRDTEVGRSEGRQQITWWGITACTAQHDSSSSDWWRQEAPKRTKCA